MTQAAMNEYPAFSYRRDFRIGAVPFCILSEQPLQSSGLFTRFETAPSAPKLCFTVRFPEQLPWQDTGVRLANCSMTAVGDTVRRFYYSPDAAQPFACTEEQQGETCIFIRREQLPWGTVTEQLFPLLALQHSLLRERHLLLHGAFLRYRGDGILFTGRSGIGKTTQSRLWQRLFAAEPVNEDRAVVGCLPDAVSVCGVPVAGSSPFCTPDTAPLRAIIVLGQGPDNRIARLSPAKAVPRIMDSVYLTSGFAADRPVLTELAIEIAERVPVWQLVCLPDEDSARLTFRQVFQGST